MTRYEVFSILGSSNRGDEDYDEDYEGEGEEEPWMLEATRVYEKSLMLLAEQDPGVAGEDGDGAGVGVGCGL
jgi:hypothetical protein